MGEFMVLEAATHPNGAHLWRVVTWKRQYKHEQARKPAFSAFRMSIDVFRCCSCSSSISLHLSWSQPCQHHPRLPTELPVTACLSPAMRVMRLSTKDVQKQRLSKFAKLALGKSHWQMVKLRGQGVYMRSQHFRVCPLHYLSFTCLRLRLTRLASTCPDLSVTCEDIQEKSWSPNS